MYELNVEMSEDQCVRLVEQILGDLKKVHDRVDDHVSGRVVDIVHRAVDTITLLCKAPDLSEPYLLDDGVPLEDGVGDAILQLLDSEAELSDQDRKKVVVLLTRLSRPRVVTGSIEGGVLNLGEVPEGVSIDIRDYDVESFVIDGDEELLKEDENGAKYFEVG